MTEITCKEIRRIEQYWLIYKKEDGGEGHIQCCACANNFAIHRGGEENCIGLRYEKDGFGCYELFNVGHTLIKFPLKATGLRKLLGSGKYEDALREQYESIEQVFNGYGWKTVKESN